MKPGRDARSHTRHAVQGDCTLELGDRVLRARLENVSVGGALVQSSELPEPNQTLLFTMPHMGSVRGTVVRRTSGGFAIRFDPEEAKAVGINDVITFVVNRDLFGPSEA